MAASFTFQMICLVLAITVIVLLTVRFRIHAFFALLAASFIVGGGCGIPVADILIHIKQGFGNIMSSLGLIIVMGTILGMLLEFSGSSRAMANFILRIVGERNAAIAISLTGFITGLPIFCDSGYIVLNGLNLSIAKRTATPVIVTSVCLAAALLSVHCLVPPHPGMSAAAITINVDFGKLMLIGTGVALPAMIAGHVWARFAGRRYDTNVDKAGSVPADEKQGPGALMSFLPVIVPIFLIAGKSLLTQQHSSRSPLYVNAINLFGDPVIALAIGAGLALISISRSDKNALPLLMADAVEKAGGILVVIGAGGGFGNVIASAGIGRELGAIASVQHAGILFPFLLTALLKTAQGSSTVAIITASTIVAPLLSSIGMQSDTGRLLTALSMGAGSMMVSHVNDAYFWVIARFSGLSVKSMLRVYSMGTVIMGLVTFGVVYILSLVM